MKLNFEVLVSKFHDQYKAVCPAFPECIGEGDNEDEAVEDLGDAITLHLSDTVRKTLDDIKQLGLLRRVDLEKEKGLSFKPSISIKKDPVKKDGKILFSGQLPINKELLKRMDKKQSGSKIKRILGIGTVPGGGPVPLIPSLLDDLQSPVETELHEEGLLFGVPLSLN